MTHDTREIPVIAGNGDKVKFKAGFKSTQYPLAAVTAALLGQDQFRLSCQGASGAEDFIFSSSKAAEHVQTFGANGGRVELVAAPGAADRQPAASDVRQAAAPVQVVYEDAPSPIAPADAAPTAAPVVDKKAAIEKYRVIYLGGLSEYHKKKSGSSIDFLVFPEAFHLLPTSTSKWFAGLTIPHADIVTFEIVQRQVSSFEGIVGGLDSRQLNQSNNIQIDFRSGGQELLLRLEMLSGVTVMGQAVKCRELMDRLREHGILAKCAGRPAASATAAPDDIPAQIIKLAGLRDAGILSPGEFEAKKTELLARL